MLDWTKATITTTSEGIEAITGHLINLGVYGVEIIDKTDMVKILSESSSQWDYIDESLRPTLHECDVVYMIFYLGTDGDSIDLLQRVKQGLDSLGAAAPNFQSKIGIETVNDQDWLHQWKKYFQPIQIGKVLIVPEWDSSSHESEIVFTIDPGSAFGTGQHATTNLCIEALQEYLQVGDCVLDIGCGSGILSIISLLLGASHVTAFDIDPVAIEVTKKNSGLNPVDQSALQLHVGDILSDSKLYKELSQNKYDIVVANIVADVIIGLSHTLNDFVKPGGIFIASGIIDERLEDVLDSLQFAKLSVVDIKTADGWCCIVAKLESHEGNN